MPGSLFSISSSSSSSQASLRSLTAATPLVVLSRPPPRNYGSLLAYQFLKSARSLGLQQVGPRPRAPALESVHFQQKYLI